MEVQTTRCHCGSIVSDEEILNEYIARGKREGEKISRLRDERVSDIQKMKISKYDKVILLYELQDELKSLFREQLKGILTELGLKRLCCLNAFQTNANFDAERYYEIP